jgi:60S ribosome biogenesis protein Rrp14
VQDRLREHAEAFDGLLSLIPAKHYYGGDNSVRSWRHTSYSTLTNSSAGPVEEKEANEGAGSRGKESKT